MEKFQMIFLHEHKITFAYAFKDKDIYTISKFYSVNEKNKIIGDFNKDNYIYIQCEKCNSILYSNENKNTILFIPPKTNEKVINCFNSSGGLLSIYLASNTNNNIFNYNNYDTFNRYKFYKLKLESKDDDFIYIGTLDEKREYFKKNYLEYKSNNEKLLKDKITQSNLIENLKRQNSEIKKNNQSLEKNNKKLNEDIKNIQKELETQKNSIILHPPENKEETYDIVVSINSMFDLSAEGWKIKYPKGKKQYLDKSGKKTMIIGVVGNGNKGKSFILGKLSDYKIPQGFTITTEGLSVRYGEKEDHCIAILDSAGQEMPLLNKEINLKLKDSIKDKGDIYMDECLRDKLITEAFLQQFIIETSHILILVVGSITLNEQKILERVKKALPKDKFLFVIHNLQNYQTKEQVEGYIENTLKKLFNTSISETSFQNIDNNCHRKYYVEENNNKITHLIFVNDFSSIAKYYNEPTINFLKKKLDVEQNREEFSVVEKCKEFLFKIQLDFFEKPLDLNDFSEDDNDKIILKPNKEIKLKKVFIDEIGKTIVNSADEPQYYYYSENKELIICIEYPGENTEIKAGYSIGNEFLIFEFKGTRSGFNINKDEYEIHHNLKKENQFHFYINIPRVKNICISPNDKGKFNWYHKSQKDGIFTFKYKLNSGSSELE